MRRMLPQAPAESKRFVGARRTTSRLSGLLMLYQGAMLAPMVEEVSKNLARNIRAARELHGLSQQQMANRSGVPRPTWANLESGEANPTVGVLTRVASALNTPLEALLAAPPESGVLTRRRNLPATRRGKVSARKLLPAGVTGAELERLELRAGGQLVSPGRAPGTKEYLVCEQGELELALAEQAWTLEAGDVLMFSADQRHTYRALGGEGAVAYTLLLLA